MCQVPLLIPVVMLGQCPEWDCAWTARLAQVVRLDVWTVDKRTIAPRMRKVVVVEPNAPFVFRIVGTCTVACSWYSSTVKVWLFKECMRVFIRSAQVQVLEYKYTTHHTSHNMTRRFWYSMLTVPGTTITFIGIVWLSVCSMHAIRSTINTSCRSKELSKTRCFLYHGQQEGSTQ